MAETAAKARGPYRRFRGISQAIQRSPMGEAAAMPRRPYGQTRANLMSSACPDALSTVRGRLALATFDTKPPPPYNAPLVRANSASAIILLRAFRPSYPTHSAGRRFRRALTRLALFSVSNGVWACSALSSPRAYGPRVRMRDGGSNANDSSSYIERDFLGFPQ